MDELAHGPHGVEELDWHTQSPGTNPTEHLLDDLEWRLQARPSRPTSVHDLRNAFLENHSNIPINTLLNIVDSLPRRVKAITVHVCVKLSIPIILVI